MTTISDYIKNCNLVIKNLPTEQRKVVLRNKDKITNLNKNQFTDGLGSDDKPLFTSLRGFNGTYAPNYKKQGLYDFFETGSFIKGLFVKMVDDDTFEIDSNGKGDSEKSLFINSYSNLFGLDSYYRNILNNDIIAPELTAYIKKYL